MAFLDGTRVAETAQRYWKLVATVGKFAVSAGKCLPRSYIILSLRADMADCSTPWVRKTGVMPRSRNLGLKAYFQMSVLSRSQNLTTQQLEERRNRQDLIEDFKISQGKSGLQDLFTLNKNNKGTGGHTLKLIKMWCTRDCRKYFFLQQSAVNRCNMQP